MYHRTQANILHLYPYENEWFYYSKTVVTMYFYYYYYYLFLYFFWGGHFDNHFNNYSFTTNAMVKLWLVKRNHG